MVAHLMVDKAKVKLYEYAGRHSVNLPSALVKDSAFPFDSGEELQARIEGERLIIEKPSKGRGA